MTLRWGIVTAGKICHDFVNSFNSYPEKGDQAIVAIAARDRQRAADFAKLHSIPNVFDSYQSMAASKDIDVVYIGALNPDHYDLAKMYLENGKHVLCEKPLCLNYKQAKSLIDLAEKKKLFLMEAVWSRFSPAYEALEKEISSGKVGDVQFVQVNFGVPIASVDRLRLKSMGGSAILDLGIYVLQFSQFVFKDEPIKVTTVGEVNEDGVDMVETVVLQYSGGRYAVLNVNSKLRFQNNATVVGTKGRVVAKEPFHFPTEVEKSDGSVEKFPLHQSPISYNFQYSAGLVYEALEVARCIRAGLLESPRMTHKESLLLAKLEDEVRKQLGVHYDADDMEYPRW